MKGERLEEELRLGDLRGGNLKLLISERQDRSGTTKLVCSGEFGKQLLRILFLEDSQVDAELIAAELRTGGVCYESRLAGDRETFEREIKEFRPEIILADYSLPSMNGADALAYVQLVMPGVPVIIVSGAVGEDTAVELLKSGATDFVLKDRLPRLVPAVRRAMREVVEHEARRGAEAALVALNAKLEQLVVERTLELRHKNSVMEEDLAMARELQIAILPHHFPALPKGASDAASALKFCNIFRPTSFVSGDFFNVVRVSDTAVGILICDVMGHGVRAALVSAMIRALEEQLYERSNDPGGLLTEINRALCSVLQQAGSTIFTTAFYMIIDIGNSTIRFASAAHPSPLRVQHRPDDVLPISARETTGPVLGIFEKAEYRTYSHPMARGDVILLFTDGLFEVEGEDGETFNEKRLQDLVLKHADLGPAELMQTVFSTIENFASEKVFSDDVCLVGIEIARLAGDF